MTAIPIEFRSSEEVEVQLRSTGERYLPEMEGDIEMEHLHRYAIARDLAYGKDVLDIACGEGYGSELLATVARRVTGVDISEEAIAHAARKYVRPNIAFAVGSCACIPLPDVSVDLVVSFETIEHHDQHLEMMAEIRRVLRPDGVVIISSPDKHEYSDVPGYKNEHHVKELYRSEFLDLLATGFKHVRIFGQRVYFGSLVAPTDGRATRFATYNRRDESIRREPGIVKPIYYIGLASNVALPTIHGGLYDGTSYLSAIAGRDREIASLIMQAIAERDGQIGSLNQAVAERDRQLDGLNQTVAERDGFNQAVAERDRQINALNRSVAERDGQITVLSRSVAERDGRINALNRSVAERYKQINALNRLVAQRDVQITELNRGLTKRDEKIVGLNRALAAEDAKLRALHSSTSWRVTAPLRFLKTAATSLQPRRRLRKAVSITATSLYKALPLSVGRKVKLKGWLFLAFPLLFGHTAAYRRWAALMARKATDDTSPVFANVPVPPSNDTAGRSRADGASPRPPRGAPRQPSGTLAVASASLPTPVISAEFNAQYYLKRYPDVAAAGIDPYEHFMTHGKAQGRSGCPPKLILHERRQSLYTEKEYVLVVTHEATRTGAPILAWNLCCELRARFNVVALLLGGGDIAKFFDQSCDVVVGPYSPMDRDPIAQSHVINDLRRRYNIKFAIVNSIASRSVLRPLAEKGIPSVLLIHEFYEFHCSAYDLVSALTWAGDVVFSASIVQQSASFERTKLAVASSHVLPQGKLRIPREAQTTTAIEEDIARIKRHLMIEHPVNKPFVVLGVGTVEYRKGVDLFIATATEIMRLAPESNVVMVWVGSIVDSYLQYAGFIREQAERSGLGDRFILMGETPHIQAVYDIADLCLISSRLDPLPNVAIEAMAAGTPVLCFDKATGVAEILASDAETSSCVLPFLSVEATARKIIEFYRSPEYTASMSERMRLLANARFDMESYVGKLVDLAANVAADLRQQECDVAALQDSHDFLADFYVPRASTSTREDAIRRFVKCCQNRIYIRKPAPGFDPQRYARHHNLEPRQLNPFLHFIKAGKPAGPWQETVINLDDDIACPNERLRVAVHVHAFYPDLLTNIIRRLASNGSRCDLFISVTSDAASREVRNRLEAYGGGSYLVRCVPNRGRDIGPLATEFAAELMDYDVIGHFHTKKSVHVVGSNLVRDWADFLAENLLGGKYRAMDKILSMFGQDAMLGLVFADDPHLIGWDENRMYAERLGRRIGIDSLPEPFFPFPVGTMFWARPQALEPLFDLRLGWDDYPAEPLPIDGSMLHAMERLLPFIVEKTGFGRMVTYAPGITR